MSIKQSDWNKSNKRLVLTYGSNGEVQRSYKDPNRKQVDSSRPFQAGSGGVGIGGERRRKTIDKAVRDMGG